MMSTRFVSPLVPVVVCALLLAGCGSGADSSSSSDGRSSTLSANMGGFPESWAPGCDIEAGYMRVPYENVAFSARRSGASRSPNNSATRPPVSGVALKPSMLS
jgi:hypothetical protein